MAGDRAQLLDVLDDASDLLFGYTLESVNTDCMDEDDFATLVAECCTRLGIAEPDDFSVVPRDPDAFTDYFLGLWDGSTRRSS